MDSKGANRDNTPQGGSLASKSSGSSTPSLPDYIPSPLLQKKLLAFRTITTLLSHVQHQVSFKRSKFGSNPVVGSDLQAEVLLCDALAHLAIIDHKIIALTTNHQSHLQSCPKQPNELSVIACYPPDEKDRPSTSTLATMLYKVVDTRHYSEKSERNQVPLTQYPSITKVQPPSDYPEGSDDRKQTLYGYLDALEENWKQPILESHLWILSELLITKDASCYKRLLRYSIATCHPKIITRLRTTHSKMFIQSLKTLSDFPFGSGRVRDRHPHEIQNDRTFLRTFV